MNFPEPTTEELKTLRDEGRTSAAHGFATELQDALDAFHGPQLMIVTVGGQELIVLDDCGAFSVPSFPQPVVEHADRSRFIPIPYEGKL